VENSKIEWCSHTFNPWRGCTQVSPGCANCYAETLSKRNPAVLGVWGDHGTRVIAAESYWKLPLKWDKEAREEQLLTELPRRRVFCASLADVFEDRAELEEPRVRLFDLILATPHLDWLLLTKRPENILRLTPPAWSGPDFPGDTPQGDGQTFRFCRPNVWLGASVENQATADERIPHLLKIPAAVRFLSCEPLLAPVDLTQLGFPDGSGTRNALTGQFRLKVKGVDGHPDFVAETQEPKLPRIDWVIVGGESGHGARPMHPDWARSLRDQCQNAAVPFFFKQWGEYGPEQVGKVMFTPVHSGVPMDTPASMFQVGKKVAGRLLDGREWSEFPKVPA